MNTSAGTGTFPPDADIMDWAAKYDKTAHMASSGQMPSMVCTAIHLPGGAKNIRKIFIDIRSQCSREYRFFAGHTLDSEDFHSPRRTLLTSRIITTGKGWSAIMVKKRKAFFILQQFYLNCRKLIRHTSSILQMLRIGSTHHPIRKSTTRAIVLLFVVCGSAQSSSTPTDETERKIDSILIQMTIEEKIDLLGGVNDFFVRGVPRLSIPRFKMADGPLGVRNDGPATTMAAGIALAATWNPALAERSEPRSDVMPRQKECIFYWARVNNLSCSYERQKF